MVTGGLLMFDPGGITYRRLFYLVMLIACVAVTASEYVACPISKGFVSRNDGNCCKPIECGPDEGYKLCKGTGANPGYDSCYKCPPGQLNVETIRTIDFPIQFELCREPDCHCPPESKLMNLQMCLKGEKENCKCDVNRGFYGQDPLACERVNRTIMIKMQQQGHELLLTGTCIRSTGSWQVQVCKEGYYKSKSDNSSCVPYKICAPGYKVQFNGSKTQNRKCVRDIFTTSKRKINVQVIKKSTPAVNVTREKDSWPTSTKNDEEAPIYPYVVAALVVSAVVLGIVVLIFIIWHCKKGSSNKRLSSDIELCNRNNDQGVAPDTEAPSGHTDNEDTGLLNVVPQINDSLIAPPPNTDQDSIDFEAGSSLGISSLFDEKNATGKQIAIVIPSKPDAESEDEGQILASPVQNDTGILYVGGANTNMFAGVNMETVHIFPQDHPTENDEETASKEL